MNAWCARPKQGLPGDAFGLQAELEFDESRSLATAGCEDARMSLGSRPVEASGRPMGLVNDLGVRDDCAQKAALPGS